MADPSYQPKVYHLQGGDIVVVASGGQITVESGGIIENSGTIKSDVIAEKTSATGVTVDGVILKDTTVDVNGTADAIILDADADTTISAPTDDQIDFECGGVDSVKMNASGMQVAGIARTATVGGGTTGLIPVGSSFVTITAGGDANSQVSLPVGTVGDVIRLYIGATGCELISSVAADKVNDVVVGATNELALAADTNYICTYVAATLWIVRGFTKLGADIAALVPDALA